MSGVIKSSNVAGHSSLRPLAEPQPAALVIPIGKHDEEREALLRRIARLEDDLRRRELEVDDLRASADKAREEGQEQGFESGMMAAQDRQAERLELLEKSLQKAETNLKDGVASLSRLSALLAQDCVEIILGNGGDRAEFIGRIIETQLAKIDRAMLCEVRLSRLDFPDDHSLSLLLRRLGGSQFDVAAQDDLPSGACIMMLRLGRISVGIDQQWSVLKNQLGELALPERLR